MTKIYGSKIESNITVAGVEYYVTLEQLNNDKIINGDKILLKREKANKFDKNAIKVVRLNSKNNPDIKLGYLPKNIAVLFAHIYNQTKIKGEILAIYSSSETIIIIIKICIEFLKQKWLSSLINIKKWTKIWEILDAEINCENIKANLLINEISIIKNCLRKEIADYDNVLSALKRIPSKSRLKKEVDRLITRFETLQTEQIEREGVKIICEKIALVEDSFKELKEKTQEKLSGNNFIIDPQFQNSELEILQTKQIEKELYYELLLNSIDYLAINFLINMNYKQAGDPLDRLCDQQGYEYWYEVERDFCLQEIERIKNATANNSGFLTMPSIGFLLHGTNDNNSEVNIKSIIESIMFSINFVLKNLGTMKHDLKKIINSGAHYKQNY